MSGPSNTAALSKINADIILALTKMGIYLERDKASLDKLKPMEKYERVSNAFEKAVENCCIFSLLFTKRELGPGKLVLSAKPQWEGWKDSREILVRDRAVRLPAGHPKNMEALVKGLGTIIQCVMLVPSILILP